MLSFRFIHCSDLPIDSPFKGIGSVHPQLAERLRDSTFQAFQNVVELAMREKVDAVVIAGDIYDGADKSLQAQVKFRVWELDPEEFRVSMSLVRMQT